MKAILGEFWIRHKIASFAQTKCGWWSRDHFNPYKLCGFNVSEMLKNSQAYFNFLLNILYLSVELLTFTLAGVVLVFILTTF